jgi:hypothetical protein
MCDPTGIFVYSIATGETETEDIYSTYVGSVNDQVCPTVSLHSCRM